MAIEQEPEYSKISRRTFLSGLGGGILIGGGLSLWLKELAEAFLAPRPKPATPLSAVPTVGPVPSVELPPDVRQLDKSQREQAERTLRRIEGLLEEYLPESIFTASDKSAIEHVKGYDDAAFTLWVRDVQKAYFSGRSIREYWKFDFGQNNHRFLIELQYNQRVGVSLTHIQGQLSLEQVPQLDSILVSKGTHTEVRPELMENFINSALKLPSDTSFEVSGDGVLSGKSTDLTPITIIAYATPLGVVGLIRTDSPFVIEPYKIERDRFGIPQIIPEGNPGGFPRG